MIRKTIWLFFLLACGTALSAQETVHVDAVPQEIQMDFGQRFEEPKKVVWFELPNSNWGVRFQLLGEPVEVVYDGIGRWLQTEMDIAYNQLPDSARAHCRGRFPDFRAKQVRKVSTRRFGIVYEVTVKKDLREVYLAYDMHGKPIEEKELEVEEVPESKGLRGKISKLMKK